MKDKENAKFRDVPVGAHFDFPTTGFYDCIKTGPRSYTYLSRGERYSTTVGTIDVSVRFPTELHYSHILEDDMTIQKDLFDDADDTNAEPTYREADRILYLSDSRGIYIPRDFVECTYRSCISGVTDEDLEACTDPDSEGYWDAWAHVEANAIITDQETGKEYNLYQDGDLWLIERGAEYDEKLDTWIIRVPDRWIISLPEKQL